MIYIEKISYVCLSYYLETEKREDLKVAYSFLKRNSIVPKGLRRPMRLVLAASRGNVNREPIRKQQLGSNRNRLLHT